MSGEQAENADAMEVEFDVVPGWTVDAVRHLGGEHALPAACRGSGGPGTLGWLTAHLGLHEGSTLLDSGAGMGGPAALAARDTGARVVAVEPMTGACRAAVNLFSLPTVAAVGQQLPFAEGTFDAAWSLGVLPTSTDQPGQLAELARVVRPGGAIGLLVYTRRAAHLDEHPDGNYFPTPDELASMLTATGLHTRAQADLADLPEPTPAWTHRAETVNKWIERHHGDDPSWAQADTQQQVLARLLGTGQVGGSVVVAVAKTTACVDHNADAPGQARVPPDPVRATPPAAVATVGPAYFEKHAALPRAAPAPVRKRRRTFERLRTIVDW